jgi:hypothetical protein
MQDNVHTFCRKACKPLPIRGMLLLEENMKLARHSQGSCLSTRTPGSTSATALMRSQRLLHWGGGADTKKDKRK